MGWLYRTINREREIKKNTDELIWAEIFDNTIRDSEWFHTGICPGRWAVGFPYLYVMYRVLNEIRPDMILEIGMGQTTKMIAEYLNWSPESCHIAVEQDEQWVEHMRKSVKLDSSDVIVMQTELVTEVIKGKEAQTTHYAGFKDRIPEEIKKHENRKIGFISIDGPSTLSGQTEGTSSRRDILELDPNLMAEEFVILMDDIERDANRKLVGEITEKLLESGIHTKTGEYWGQKGVAVIASEGLKWYTTL